MFEANKIMQLGLTLLGQVLTAIIALLPIFPIAKILQKAGFSGWWAIWL